jgi:hypothetical protein
MLPAIGAASLALDAIQSLTSSQSSSSPSQAAASFGPALADAGDTSSSPNSGTVGGFSSAQISADNISTLLDAQSLASANLAEAIDPGNQTSDSSNSSSDSSSAQSNSASGAASSTYSSIDQLMQSTAVPLGFNPFSVSV